MNDFWMKALKDHALPAWFERPTSAGSIQRSFFPENIHDVLARLKVSPDELARWRQHGWISFDVQTAYQLESAQVGELTFVRDVARSGLPDAVLRMLFAQLPAPMTVDPNLIAFSFTHGWVLPAFTSEADLADYIEQNVDTWLEGLAEEGHSEQLARLKDLIERLLTSSDQLDG